MKSAGRACCRGRGSQPNYGENLVENKKRAMKNREKVEIYVDHLWKKPIYLTSSRSTATDLLKSQILLNISNIKENRDFPNKYPKNHDFSRKSPIFEISVRQTAPP